MDGCVIDFLAPEHVASFVSWLAFAAPRDVTGNVFVVHGTAIELPRMDAERRHVRSDAGTDAELLRLRDRLFRRQRNLAPSRPCKCAISVRLLSEDSACGLKLSSCARRP
jgi:hypothetical protein